MCVLRSNYQHCLKVAEGEFHQLLVNGRSDGSSPTIHCHILLFTDLKLGTRSPSPDLLVAGEGLHGIQQLGDSGAEQADGQSLCQVLSGQVEHTRCGHQVDVQGVGVALHPTQHQLQETTSRGRNHTGFCSQ